MSTVEFNAEAMIEEAKSQTGFDDFGELAFREGLEKLIETYDTHIKDEAGRQRSRDRVVMLLATRLRCENAFKTIPEIAEQTIEAPIFVTGLPRSGTSALLNMLAQAPENRGLLQWEIHFPEPWPDSKPGDDDPRYPFLVQALEDNSDSEFRKIHYVDADTPEECVMVHALAFSGVQLGFEIMLEPYRSWVMQQDLTPMYAYQKRLLQMLNWRNPGQRWVLKAPAHMWAIDNILEVFPDARFIWCHRQPEAVVASINSMNRSVMGMYAGADDYTRVSDMGARVMEWYARSLEQGLASREKLPPELFVDCSQQEFSQTPLQLAERIYQQFDLPMSAQARDAFQAYIDANPKGKHGKHQYDLSQFALDSDGIANRFAFYTQDARWPISV